MSGDIRPDFLPELLLRESSFLAIHASLASQPFRSASSLHGAAELQAAFMRMPNELRAVSAGFVNSYGEYLPNGIDIWVSASYQSELQHPLLAKPGTEQSTHWAVLPTVDKNPYYVLRMHRMSNYPDSGAAIGSVSPEGLYAVRPKHSNEITFLEVHDTSLEHSRLKIEPIQVGDPLEQRLEEELGLCADAVLAPTKHSVKKFILPPMELSRFILARYLHDNP